MLNNNNQEMPATSSGVCSVCHQPILPTYYFCPNCGVKLDSGPLSTTIITQIGIYLHSIILPFIVFITISKWRGLKYSRSSDSKVRLVGIIAWILLVLSTAFLFWGTWYVTIQLQNELQTSLNQMNLDLNSLGF
jgi:hypothetical protein